MMMMIFQKCFAALDRVTTTSACTLVMLAVYVCFARGTSSAFMMPPSLPRVVFKQEVTRNTRMTQMIASPIGVMDEACDYINPEVTSRFPQAFLPELRRPNSVSLQTPPPSTVICVPNFIREDECQFLIKMGEKIAATGNECEEYLNARVNTEIADVGVSNEASDLIGSMDDECAVSLIDSSAGGGFRVRANEKNIENLLSERLLFLMGLQDRSDGFLFEESPVSFSNYIHCFIRALCWMYLCSNIIPKQFA